MKSGLLSTGALCLLSAHAGAVVTSAADHFDVVVLVSWVGDW